MPVNFREHADLTKIIKSILDSYPLGNGILRELLQNSDDASATRQTFILDLRKHPSESVVDQDLVGCQGPALLAVNDTLFSDADWKAISTLHSSSKTKDETKIGKFGIGITDNPHFLSGRNLVIFDPHERFAEGKEGGILLDILDEGHLYGDQLGAFKNTLNCDADGSFPGTVVRLPLRTASQAAISTIKSTVVNPLDVRQLFEDFVEKELSVVMLFLKHIRYICLKVISADGQEHFVGSAEIPDTSISAKRAFARNGSAQQQTFRCTIHLTCGATTTKQSWRVYHAVRSTEETASILRQRLGYDVASKLADDKLFSHVALAFPVDNRPANFNGRLFTLLPLPIHTGFPMHMHAILALTQDRQSLRNIEEVGTGAESRERLLVTWNCTIFDEFLPSTWAALLHILVDAGEAENIWSAWPVQTGSGYWSNILSKLMKQVLHLDLPIFPTFSNAKSYVRLSSALIASETRNLAVLTALSNAQLAVVVIPQHLEETIPSAFSSQLLHPRNVSNSLKNHLQALQILTEEDKDHILRYLTLAPGNVTQVLGLPLVPLANGCRVALSTAQQYITVTGMEGGLFGDLDCNGQLIDLSIMPTDVAEVFRTTNLSNISQLGISHIRTYLNISFGLFSPADDEVLDSNKFEWIQKFWKWLHMSTWHNKTGLLQVIKDFHLLPTTQGTLRKLGSCILLPVSEPIMAAWRILDVGFLHPNLAQYSSVFQNFTANSNDAAFKLLIGSISPHNIDNLDSRAALWIQGHLVQMLSSLTRAPPKLDLPNKNKFLQLPIFPIRLAIPEPKGQKKLSKRDFGPALETVLFVHVEDSCPLPIIPKHTFFDIGVRSSVLGIIVNPNEMKRALDEIGILELAVDHLVDQPQPLLDALLFRIISRLADLSDLTRRKLHAIPFVQVIDRQQRVPPFDVINPRSRLASLYDGESGKLPTGPWAIDPYLSILLSYKFYQTEITSQIVKEHQYPTIFCKAQRFLALLDDIWPDIQPTSISWLPIQKDCALATPMTARARDKGEGAYLFDLVLSTVDGRVNSPGLQKALGWDNIPTYILQQQLERALSYKNHQPKRLFVLIKEFSKPRCSLSLNDMVSLRNTVSGCSTSGGRNSACSPVLRNFSTWSLQSCFLGKDGLHSKVLIDPCLETLLSEVEALASLVNYRVTESHLRETIELLKAIATLIPTCSQDDYERINIPGHDGVLHPIGQVYFVDCQSDFHPDQGFASNSAISESLARKLKIQFLSSLELGYGEDDDEDDLQMGEDFTKRVEGVLKEHDVTHALNEFLANAIDANAQRFEIMLDERTFDSTKILAPGLAALQRQPSLLLYNEAVFTSNDFRGLRQVGQGGKRLNPDSIGRYGLGALSLFHFTDVVEIVSNEYFLILDPSGKYLPPIHGRSRTSLLRPISIVARRFADQLLPFESLHGFSKKERLYSGTLFRLPLRNTATALSSSVLSLSDCENLINGPYFELAKHSMYFTRMKEVSATRQPPVGSSVSLWSVVSERPVMSTNTDHKLVFVTASKQDSVVSSQVWLITTSATPISSIPHNYYSVVEGMGLQDSKVGAVVQMALLLPSANTSYGAQPDHPYFLFSVLRLPVQTSLSVHISAPWAISSSRRYIIFEPADLTGNRVPQAAWNTWILKTLIPTLYKSTIYEAATTKHSRQPQNPFSWWPVNKNTSDSISREIVQAFYDSVPESSELICLTVSNERIAPVNAVFSMIQSQYKYTSGVYRLLRKLQTPDFVELPLGLYSLMRTASTASQLKGVEPSFVQNILSAGTTKDRLPKLFRTQEMSFDVQTINDVLGFLLSNGICPIDLPLIILADGTLTGLNSLSPSRYISTGEVPVIFNQHHFLHKDMPLEIQNFLLQSPMNVRLFDATAVVDLVQEKIKPQPRCQHTREIERWIQEFWRIFPQLPGPPDPHSFGSIPLISISNGEYISLQYCQRDDVITEPALLQSCNKVFNLESFLKAIHHKTNIFDSLSTEETLEISRWIQANVNYCDSATSRSVLKDLPIWEARQDKRNVLKSARHVKMFDTYGLGIDMFDEYTKPGVALAGYNYALSTVRSWPPKSPNLTSEHLAQLLVFPNSLDASSLTQYSNVLMVAHLAILTQKVAVDHPQNRTLLQQLCATYRWLNDHTEDAREPLLCRNEALFLNVDDAHSEDWEWQKASELLFDIEWDFPETNTFAVRRFLQDYRPLLLAAGAGTEHNIDFKQKTSAQDDNSLRDSFNNMRKAGQLTDIVLVPMYSEQVTDCEALALRGHSMFLAAAIPHVRDGLCGWAESGAETYSFPGTYFGACTVLGKFCFDVPLQKH
ncbi:hypothetical protein R3P38DRAFT_3311332 [Favolaschia claudopus]|uniref:Sacsin/Nov domain-containing protein n=1 Tax=Favolaschia claudopus TaxID=2862362 RepID=A0AAW0CG64_9AGAR